MGKQVATITAEENTHSTLGIIAISALKSH
jgi:hypothetical protein